eukprot:364600-Chlamydomonas_euryale.AAC.11
MNTDAGSIAALAWRRWMSGPLVDALINATLPDIVSPRIESAAQIAGENLACDAHLSHPHPHMSQRPSACKGAGCELVELQYATG